MDLGVLIMFIGLVLFTAGILATVFVGCFILILSHRNYCIRICEDPSRLLSTESVV